MPKLKCIHETCSLFDREVTHQSLKLIMGKNNCLEPFKTIFCVECNNPMYLVQTNVIPNVNIGRFKSMSMTEKREMIKKRAGDDYKKNHSKEAQLRKQEMIKEIKNSVEDK